MPIDWKKVQQSLNLATPDNNQQDQQSGQSSQPTQKPKLDWELVRSRINSNPTQPTEVSPPPLKIDLQNPLNVQRSTATPATTPTSPDTFQLSNNKPAPVQDPFMGAGSSRTSTLTEPPQALSTAIDKTVGDWYGKPGAIQSGVKAVAGTLDDANKRIDDAISTFKSPQATSGDKAASVGEALLGFVNVLALGPTAAIETAKNVQLPESGNVGAFDIPRYALHYGGEGVSWLGNLVFSGLGKKVSGVLTTLPEAVKAAGVKQQPLSQKEQAFADELGGVVAMAVVGKIAHSAMKIPEEIKNTNEIVKASADVLNIPTETNAIGQIRKPSLEEIKQQYRRASQEAHPDKGGSVDAFKIVSSANQVLTDYVTLPRSEFNAKWQVAVDAGNAIIRQKTVEKPALLDSIDKKIQEKSNAVALREQSTGSIEKTTLNPNAPITETMGRTPTSISPVPNFPEQSTTITEKFSPVTQTSNDPVVLRDTESRIYDSFKNGVPANDEIVSQLNQVRTKLNDYIESEKQSVISVPSEGVVPLLDISIVPYPDGKFGVSYSANTSATELDSRKVNSEIYPTKEAAIQGGKNDVLDFISREVDRANSVTELTQLKQIKDALTAPSKPKITSENPKIPSEIKVEESVKTPYYHGTRLPLEQKKGLFFLTDSKIAAENYAHGGGGGRNAISYMEKTGKPLIIDVKDVVNDKIYKRNPEWSKDSSTQWFKASDGKQLSRIDAEKGLRDGDLTEHVRNGRVDTYYPKTNKTLNLHSVDGSLNQEAKQAIQNLELKGNTREQNTLKQIKEDAAKGRFHWDTTKYQIDVWNKIIVPQLEKMDFDSIAFTDDGHETLAVFDTKQLTNEVLNKAATARKKPVVKNKINLIEHPSTPEEESMAKVQGVILDQIVAAEAGKRLAIKNEDNAGYTFSRIPSTFPDWIPEELRRKPLLNAVAAHIMDGTVPTKAAEVRLYDVVRDEMSALPEAVDELNKYVEIPFLNEQETLAYYEAIQKEYNREINGTQEQGVAQHDAAPLESSSNAQNGLPAVDTAQNGGRDAARVADFLKGLELSKNTPNVSGGFASSGGGRVGEFELRDPVAQESTPEVMKLYEEVQNVVKKYADRIGEGYLPRNAVGAFYSGTKNIRIAGMNAVSTAAHEITHFIDDKFGISQQIAKTTGESINGKPIYDSSTAKIRGEITDFYERFYPTGKRTHALATRVIEGYATLVQKYIEQPKTVTAAFPNLVKEFLQPGGTYFIPQIGEFIKDMDSIITRYQGLSDLDKIGARIAGREKVVKDSFLSTADKVVTQLFDEVFPLEVLAKKSGTHFTKGDPSLWFRNMKTSANSVVMTNIQSAKKGYWSFRNGDIVKLHDFNWKNLAQKLDEGKNMDKFGEYLVARDQHFQYAELDKLQKAYDTMAQILKETPALLDAKVSPEAEAQYKELFGDSQVGGPTFKEQLVEVKKALDDLAEILKRNGFTREEVSAAYENNKGLFSEEEKMYDALVREDLNLLHDGDIQLISDEMYKNLTSKEGYASLKRVFYDELVGPDQRSTLTSGGVKASFLKSRTGSSRAIVNPVESGMINHQEAMKKAMKQVVFNKIGEIANANVLPDMFQRQELIAIPQKDGPVLYPQEKDPNIIMARINGKRAPILVDAWMKNVMEELMTHQTAGPIAAVMIKASHTFTAGTTGNFPAFAATNFQVDQGSMMVNSRTGAKPFVSVAQSALKLYEDKEGVGYRKYLDEYHVLGGKNMNAIKFADLTTEEAMNQILENKTTPQQMAALGEKLIDVVSFLPNLSEELTRFTEYARAREQGHGTVAAFEMAGRVTGPFHHTGKLGDIYGRTWVKSIPYFNAGLQVLGELGTNLKDRPATRTKFFILATAIIAMKLVGLAAIHKATEEQKNGYRDLQPADLARGAWIPAPNGKDLWFFKTGPDNSTMGTIVEMLVEQYLYKDAKYTAMDYLDVPMSALPEPLNFQKGKAVVWDWMPLLLSPLAKIEANIRTYPKTMPLVSGAVANLPPGKQVIKSTTPVAKWIGERLNWSPIKIDAFISGYLGRASGFITGDKKAYNPTSSLVRPWNPVNGRRIQNFYEEYDRVSQNFNAMRKGKSEISNDEKKSTLTRYYQLDNVAKLIGMLNKFDVEKDRAQVEKIRSVIFSRLNNLGFK